MKKLLLILVILVLPASVMAVGPINLTGRFAGTAFANPAFDFNGDGIFARTFDARVFDQILFSAVEGVSDTALISIGTCAGPGSLELKPFGKFTFRGRFGEALFAEVDPASPNLCFDPANPSETLGFKIAGGTGIYTNATGSGVFTLHDIVRLDKLVTVPGFPFQLPAPLLIDTRGEFTIQVSL